MSETAQGNVIPDADATGAAQHVEEAAPPKALADYNRPDEYYTNKSTNSEGEFRAEASVLHTRVAATLLWVTARASYGPSGEVRGSYRCYSYGWSP